MISRVVDVVFPSDVMQGPDAAQTPFPMRVLSHDGPVKRCSFNYIFDALMRGGGGDTIATSDDDDFQRLGGILLPPCELEVRYPTCKRGSSAILA